MSTGWSGGPPGPRSRHTGIVDLCLPDQAIWTSVPQGSQEQEENPFIPPQAPGGMPGGDGLLAKQVVRVVDSLNSDLRGTEVRPLCVPLAWPDLWAVEFVGPGLLYRFVLDRRQVRALYAQLHVRLVVAPQVDKIRDRTLATISAPAAP
jgi:hypothetical protein